MSTHKELTLREAVEIKNGVIADLQHQLEEAAKYQLEVLAPRYIKQLERADKAEAQIAAMREALQEVQIIISGVGTALLSRQKLLDITSVALANSSAVETWQRERDASAELKRLDMRPWKEEDADTRCQNCGRPNPCWFANAEAWERLVPEISGVLCPTCFMLRANGPDDPAWKVISQQELRERDAKVLNEFADWLAKMPNHAQRDWIVEKCREKADAIAAGR